MLELSQQAVAIAVIPAANMKSGHGELLVLTTGRGAVPKGTITLLAQVGKDAGLPLKALRHPALIEREGRTDLELVIEEIIQDKIAPTWASPEAETTDEDESVL